jgi:hypothetical protein
MAKLDFDIALTRNADAGWRALFYPSSFIHESRAGAAWGTAQATSSPAQALNFPATSPAQVSEHQTADTPLNTVIYWCPRTSLPILTRSNSKAWRASLPKASGGVQSAARTEALLQAARTAFGPRARA